MILTGRGVFLALLLLLSGNVELNPGPICHPQASSSSTSINLVSLNVRSSVGKSALIHSIIADEGIDVLALSETWIQQDAPSVILQDPAPEGYRIIHVHRQIVVDGPTRGGGLAIISRDSISVRTHPLSSSFKPTSFELQLALVGSGQSTFILMNVYRPPSQSKSVFIDEFLDIISTISATSGNDRLLICGDVNLPGPPGSSNIDVDLQKALESLGLYQHVAQPTRGDNILDILATSDTLPLTRIALSDAGFISDHRMILISVPSKVRRSVNITRKFRNFSKINCSEFERRLLESELFSSPADNVDDFCEQLASVVTRELDRVAPLKVSSRRKSKPITRWLTPEAIKAKRTRRRLERRWKSTKNEEDRKEYRKSCQTVNKIINSSRSDYMKQRLADCTNPGDRWKAVRHSTHEQYLK